MRKFLLVDNRTGNEVVIFVLGKDAATFRNMLFDMKHLKPWTIEAFETGPVSCKDIE